MGMYSVKTHDVVRGRGQEIRPNINNIKREISLRGGIMETPFVFGIFNQARLAVYINCSIGSLTPKNIMGKTLEEIYTPDLVEVISRAMDEAEAKPGGKVCWTHTAYLNSGVVRFDDEIVFRKGEFFLIGIVTDVR